jgi:hypothetical protein
MSESMLRERNIPDCTSDDSGEDVKDSGELFSIKCRLQLLEWEEGLNKWKDDEIS